MDFPKLFHALYFALSEIEVDQFLCAHPEIFNQENWTPYGENEKYFGVIENQQASAIPALVEKITNSIDATLMKESRLAGLEPASPEAPKSMDEAIHRFFPNHNWDIRQHQRKQAENIQIIADGPKDNTSLIIYDNGEGQHPKDFETTFLSLLKGNKTEIHFVQGKFNMGGSGALVFCGKHRFQLVASKRYDGTGDFGFTLIRRHQRTEEEKKVKRHTWYEYFKINGQIPSFPIDKLDLKLYNRDFITGTIIKLYSYRMKGITDISRDLNLSLNEYLFEPALPIFTIEKPERYPKTPQPQRELYGLKRRLDKQSDTYLDKDWNFSETYNEPKIGQIKVTVYVFKSRIDAKNAKESRAVIRREFFKNNMSVLFSLNGQVQGSEGIGFISQQLKFDLLKYHLLIHVECSEMNPDFRDELFMASRDRLKEGDESRELKDLLAKHLTKGKLLELYKYRKDNLSLEGEDTSDLLKNMAKSLSINKELMNLIQQTFKLENKEKKEPKKPEDQPQPDDKKPKEQIPFLSKRFPSIFKIKGSKEETPIIKIPLGGDKIVRFDTDVENQYFDRVEEPGELQVSILNFTSKGGGGDNPNPTPSQPTSLISISQTSPDKGLIKIIFNPTNEVKVGDAFEIKATLTAPGEDLDQYFILKIVDADKPKTDDKKNADADEPSGLPPYILVYKEERDGSKTFDDLESFGITMDYQTIMHPFIENDKLERIFINMDSTVLKNYKSKLRSEMQLQMADRKYISSVYFHTLMLFAITKQKKYEFQKIEPNGDRTAADLSDYLKDIFESHYSSFLLSYGTEELIQSIDA
jgi:hypothetical protein